MVRLLNLFNHTSHSGESDFKIDCDALTYDDLDALAMFVADNIWEGEIIRDVISVPRSGDRFTEVLKNRLNIDKDNESGTILIVDDVYTTGKSMNEVYKETKKKYKDNDIHGLVIFARNDPSWWVESIFKMIYDNDGI